MTEEQDQQMRADYLSELKRSEVEDWLAEYLTPEQQAKVRHTAVKLRDEQETGRKIK